MQFSITHKISALAILLVLLTAAVIGSAFYIKGRDLLVKHTLVNISDKVEEERYRLQAHIESQRQDTLFLAQLPVIKQYIHLQHESAALKQSEVQSRDVIVNIFRSLILAKPGYIQVRYIDASGMERIRVNRHGDEVVHVPAKDLQDKSNHPYIYLALKMQEGQVYDSEINLNREYGKVEVPHLEVFRTAVPIYLDGRHAPSGLIVINAEIGHELRSIQQEVESLGKSVYITNDRGGYLVHPEREKSYGEDLGHFYRIQEEFPLSAKVFVPGNTDTKLVLLPEQTFTNQVVVFTKLFFDENHPDRFLMVVIAQDYERIVSEQVKLISGLAGWSVITVIAAILLALLFSRRLTLPLQRMIEMVNAFPARRVILNQLPVSNHDEIGLLARSFESMSIQVRDYQDSLKKMNEQLEHKVEERTAQLQGVLERYQNIVENMVDGLITIDINGIVLSFNRSAENIFGYKADEVIGSNISMLMPEPHRSQHDEYMKHYLDTGERRVVGIGREVEGMRKDGSVFSVDLAVSELYIDGERNFSGIVRDITERKRMEKMKNEFISTVSHELRTPLTSIRGSLGLVCGGAVGELPDQASEMLRIANSNTERLLLLINDILDIQKIESGQMVFRYKTVSILSFLKQAIDENQAYGSQYGVRFVLDPGYDDIYVYADRDRLMQVMSNLLSNAAKFSPEGSDVEVHAEKTNGLVRISISDHGPGIAPEFQDSLFDRFTQWDSSDSRAKGGTGLGLNIAKAIIEKHGGHISFISEPGVGTRFFFELPMMQQVSPVEEVRRENSGPGLGSGAARVLIVEDDADIAALLRRMLADEGVDADVAFDAEQALRMLRADSHRYRAMTLDLMLPGQDGLSFLNRVRQSPDTHNLPVIIISAKAEEARGELVGGAMQVLDWLSKPIDQQRLLDSIRSVVPEGRLPRILHVEDEEDVHKVVSHLLKDHCEMVWTTNVQDSRKALQNERFNLVLLDIELPDGSGFDLMELIESCVKPPRVVIFSAHEIEQQYADMVSAVLTKSRTDNETLKQIIMSVINDT